MTILRDDMTDAENFGYEKSYGKQLEDFYFSEYEDNKSMGFTPESYAEEAYRQGKGVDPEESYESWYSRHKMDRFVNNVAEKAPVYEQEMQDNATRQYNLENRSGFVRGMLSDIDSFQGSFAVVPLALGELATKFSNGQPNQVSDWLVKHGLDFYKEQERQASLNPTTNILDVGGPNIFTDEAKDPGNWAKIVGETLGSASPSITMSALAAAAGGAAGGSLVGGVPGAAAGGVVGGISGLIKAVAGPVVKSFVKKMADKALKKGAVGAVVEEIVENGVKKKVVKMTAEKAAEKYAAEKLGRYTGVFMGTWVLEGNQSYMETVSHMRDKYLQNGANEMEATYKALEETSGLFIYSTATAAAGVELIGGNMKLLEKFFGGEVGKAAKELIRIAQDTRSTPGIIGRALNAGMRLLKEAALNMRDEFGQETVQEILSMANIDFADPDFQMLSGDTLKQAMAAGISGGIVGAFLGGGSHMYQSGKSMVKGTNEVKEAADTKAGQIMNQLGHIVRNVGNEDVIQETRAEMQDNQTELGILHDYMKAERDGVSYMDAVKFIQKEAPNPTGKPFTTKALRKLVNDPSNPLQHMKSPQGEEYRGTVTRESLNEFVLSRNPNANQMPIAASQAESATEQPASGQSVVVDSGSPEGTADNQRSLTVNFPGNQQESSTGTRSTATNIRTSESYDKDYEYLSAQQRQWDLSNRTGRSAEWITGAAESLSSFNEVTEEGLNIPAHGMAKVGTLREGINNLIQILENGIDENREFYTAGLTARTGAGAGSGTSDGSAYKDGPFMIVFREGTSGKPKNSDIVGVLVNPSHTEITETLQKMYPDLVIRDYNGIKDVIAAAKTGENQSLFAPGTTIDQNSGQTINQIDNQAANQGPDQSINTESSNRGAGYSYANIVDDVIDGNENIESVAELYGEDMASVIEQQVKEVRLAKKNGTTPQYLSDQEINALAKTRKSVRKEKERAEAKKKAQESEKKKKKPRARKSEEEKNETKSKNISKRIADDTAKLEALIEKGKGDSKAAQNIRTRIEENNKKLEALKPIPVLEDQENEGQPDAEVVLENRADILAEGPEGPILKDEIEMEVDESEELPGGFNPYYNALRTPLVDPENTENVRDVNEEVAGIIKAELERLGFTFTDALDELLPNLIDRVAGKFIHDRGFLGDDKAFAVDASDALSYIIFHDLKLQQGKTEQSAEKMEQVRRIVFDWLVTGELPTDRDSFVKKVIRTLQKIISAITGAVYKYGLEERVSKRLEQLRGGKSFSFTPKPGTQALTFQQVFDSTPGLSDVFYGIVRTGGILTGSMAYMDQATVYRKPGVPSHDVDIIYRDKAAVTAAEKYFTSNYGAKRFYRFTAPNTGQLVVSVVVPQEGYTISDIGTRFDDQGNYIRFYKVLDKDGNIAGTYSFFKSKDKSTVIEEVKGVSANNLDLLEDGMYQTRYVEQKYKDGNKELPINVLSYQYGFAAKLRMLRYKDIEDLVFLRRKDEFKKNLDAKRAGLLNFGIEINDLVKWSAEGSKAAGGILGALLSDPNHVNTGLSLSTNVAGIVFDEIFGDGSFQTLVDNMIFGGMERSGNSYFHPVWNMFYINARRAGQENTAIEDILHELGIHYGLSYFLGGRTTAHNNVKFNRLREGLHNILIGSAMNSPIDAFGNKISVEEANRSRVQIIKAYMKTIELYSGQYYHLHYGRFRRYEVEHLDLLFEPSKETKSKIKLAMADPLFVEEFIGQILGMPGIGNTVMVRHIKERFADSMGKLLDFTEDQIDNLNITVENIQAIIIGSVEKAIQEGNDNSFLNADIHPGNNDEFTLSNIKGNLSGPGWAGWARTSRNSFEVSTHGDSLGKQFSAFNARLADGRTIEEAYQVGVKGYSSKEEGKRKPPKNSMTREELWNAYKALWQQWAEENPGKIEELRVASAGKILTDKFATTEISQARALAEILRETDVSSSTIEIVSTEEGEISGMRGPGGVHMNTPGIKPGMPGWLGNPVKWEGNGGQKGVSIGEATAGFKKLFLEKVENDAVFREAILALRGKKIGYYRPNNENHLQVIQDWLNEQAGVAPVDRTKAESSGMRRLADLPQKVHGEKTMTYAGIGSRNLPDHVRDMILQVSIMLEGAGYLLRTGDARGADETFASQVKTKERYTKDDATEETRGIARELHPNPGKLKDDALNLHARNTYQVFGANLDSPVDFVLCWTPDGAQHASETGHGRAYLPDTGGTGQAIRLASIKGIPVINMARAGWQKRLQRVLNGENVLETPTELGKSRTPAGQQAGAKSPNSQKPGIWSHEVSVTAPAQPSRPAPTRLATRAQQEAQAQELAETSGEKITIKFPASIVTWTQENGQWVVKAPKSESDVTVDEREDLELTRKPSAGDAMEREERRREMMNPSAMAESAVSTTIEKDLPKRFPADNAAPHPAPLPPNKAFSSKLTDEQKEKIGDGAWFIPEVDAEGNEDFSAYEGAVGNRSFDVPRTHRTVDFGARRKAVAKLIAAGGLFSRGSVVSVEISDNPNFNHAVYGPYDLKVDYGFFESSKAYWDNWRGAIHHDINVKDPVMRRMSPIAKSIYERMLVLERGLTILSGKISPEMQDAFDSTMMRIQTEGVNEVQARIDIESAIAIVEGLKQQVTERGQENMADFLSTNPDAHNRHLIASFMNSAAILRAGLTGQPNSLTARIATEDKVVPVDMGKDQSFFVDAVMSTYEEILSHLAGIGAISSEQAKRLSLESNKLSDYNAVNPESSDFYETTNFTRDMLTTALKTLGFLDALYRGIPLPITTNIGDKTELGEALELFRKSTNPNLKVLSEAEFIVGIIGLGQDQAGKESGADARLAWAYDISKLPRSFLIKMTRAGFLDKIGVGKDEKFVVPSRFRGAALEIRQQSFMQDMDQLYNARRGYFSGIEYLPRDMQLDDLRAIRPGSVLLHLGRKKFGVVGPIMSNGRFEILVPQLNKTGKGSYLTPAKNADGKVISFSHEQLASIGYIHVPHLWDFVQSRGKSDGSIHAQNIFSWENAESVMNSRAALRQAEADTGLKGLAAMGHGRIVEDSTGRMFLALASQGEGQALLEVVRPEEDPLVKLNDTMLRLHNAIRDSITEIVGSSAENISKSKMSQIRKSIRSMIKDLEDRRQITKIEADNLRADMAALYKSVIENLEKINKADGTAYQKIYSVLRKSGFLSTEDEKHLADIEEIMNASSEVSKKGKTVDGTGETQGAESGFSNADALQMMADMDFSEVLRNLFGLNEVKSFADAYEAIKSMTKAAIANYRIIKNEYSKEGKQASEAIKNISAAYRLAKMYIMAMKAIRKNNLHLIAEYTSDEVLAKDTYKLAREALGLRDSQEVDSLKSVRESLYRNFVVKSFSKQILKDRSSSFYSHAPDAVKRHIYSLLMAKAGNKTLGDLIGETTSISQIVAIRHPKARPLALHILSVMASMPTVDGDSMSMLAANATYFEAISKLPIKMKDGSVKKLNELSKEESKLVKKVLVSGGLYANLLFGLQKTKRTYDEFGGVIYPPEPKAWPAVNSEDWKTMKMQAREMGLNTAQASLGINADTSLPSSDTIDVEDLVLRLGILDIPSDAALILEGMSPEDRSMVYDYKVYGHQNVELFLQGSDKVFLSDKEFDESFTELLDQGEPITVKEVHDDIRNIEEFEHEGIVYSRISEADLQREQDENHGVEVPFDNGVITGADYELLMHMKKIFPGAFRISGGALGRNGRMSQVNINGSIYPADFKDRFVSDFGMRLLEKFRELHDRAWTDSDMAFDNPKLREDVRREMFAWEQYARQFRKTADMVKQRGKFRTVKIAPKSKLNARSAEAEIALRQEVHRTAMSLIEALVAIPTNERPEVVVHGINETGLDLLRTAEGRRSVPAEIMAQLHSEGLVEDAKRQLRLAAGFVDPQGRIHIFPAMHADAAGNIDNVELARTVFHEAIGHVALRHLLGAEYEDFMLSVFSRYVDPSGSASMTREMKVDAAEEYVAKMADRIKYNTDAQRMTNDNIGTIVDRIASMLVRAWRRLMKKFGYNVDITKVEIKEMLEKAFSGSSVKASGYGLIGPSMIPGENVKRYEEMGEWTPNRADRILKSVEDRLRYWKLLFRSRESNGELVADKDNYMWAMRTLGSRIGYLTGLAGDLEKRFTRAFEGRDITKAEVERILVALHTLERAVEASEDSFDWVADHMRRTGRSTPTEDEAARGITEEDKIATEIARKKRSALQGTLNTTTGYSAKWAREVLDDAKRRGLYDNGRGIAAEAVQIMHEISAKTLEIMEQSEMVTREFANDFRSRYRNFIAIPGASKFGFGSVGSVSVQGRSRFAAEIDAGIIEDDVDVPDAISYSFANLRNRIIESEVNITHQKMVNFAMSNPNSGIFTVFLHVNELGENIDEGGNVSYDVPPGYAVMGGPGFAAGIEDSAEKMREYEARNNLLPVYQNGVLRHFRIEHEALRNSYSRWANPARAGFVLKQLSKINRYLIAVNTMLNPEFLIPNLFRDSTAALSTLSIQGTVSSSGLSGTEFAKQFAPRIPIAMRAIFAKNFSKDEGASLTGEAAMIFGYIEEFARIGGKIQWPFQESAAETMKSLEFGIAISQKKGTMAQQAKAFGMNMSDFMKKVGDVFENATRLATYVTARENGVSPERAALLARELTVDFDRKGELGAAFNTLYLFANASLQGSLVILRTMANNPQRAAKFAAGVITLSMGVALMNIAIGGNGDDDEPNYFSIPGETRNNHLIAMLPFSDGFPLKMPLSYGYSSLWAVGQEIVNSIFGRDGVGGAVAGILSSMLNNFNPLESAGNLDNQHGWVRLLTPTVIDPFVDVYFEKTPFGTPLMPEKVYDQQPDSMRHWRSASYPAKEASRLLNAMFGGSGGKSSGITDISPETMEHLYESFTGGFGKFLAKTLGLAFAPVSGREISAKDIPVARRFLGGKLNWEDRGRFKDNYDEIQGVNKTRKNLFDNMNMAIDASLKKRATADYNDFISENEHIIRMRKRANNTFSMIKKIDKKKEILYKSGLPESRIKAQLKELDNQQKKILSNFNRQYYEIIDSN